MKEEKEFVRIRVVDTTPEFDTFYTALANNIQRQFEITIAIVESVKVINAKLVKKLVHTPLYEMRVSVGNNEYRAILFAVDDRNVILATRVVLLNGFMKKSTKDYEKQIKKALRLIEKYNL